MERESGTLEINCAKIRGDLKAVQDVSRCSNVLHHAISQKAAVTRRKAIANGAESPIKPTTTFRCFCDICPYMKGSVLSLSLGDLL